MRKGALAGAWWTQVTAQVLTAWALVLGVLSALVGGNVLGALFYLTFTGLALSLPLKSDGSLRDRAIANMSAGALLASALSFQMLGIIFSGFRMTPAQLMTLVAAVLFSVAGSLYWVRRHDGSHWDMDDNDDEGDAEAGATANV